MLFVLICTDKPDSLELRLATRPAHLAYLDTYVDKIVQAGPMLNAEGRPCGSVLVIDVEDRAAAAGFAEADPYARAGVFESTIIRPYRILYRDGAKVD